MTVERLAHDPARELSMEMRAAETLLSQLRELADGDDGFLADLVEGQTGLFEIVARIDETILEDEMIIAGLENAIPRLQGRKADAEKRIETRRTLIANALQQIGLKTHRTAIGTITVSEKAPSAIVTDEAELPSRFWKAQPPKLDKSALTAALRERRAAWQAAMALEDDERQSALARLETEFPVVPGATLSNGGFKLQIRR